MLIASYRQKKEIHFSTHSYKHEHGILQYHNLNDEYLGLVTTQHRIESTRKQTGIGH